MNLAYILLPVTWGNRKCWKARVIVTIDQQGGLSQARSPSSNVPNKPKPFSWTMACKKLDFL